MIHRDLTPGVFSPRALVTALLIGGSLLWAAAPLGAESGKAATARYISSATVNAWRASGQSVVFLDVREADEFAAGHLPGAINIVYDQVASIANRLPHDQPIIAYCIHSAHRAPEAVKTLRHLGFDRAFVLEGGIVAWQAEGLAIRASRVAGTPKILPLTKRCAELGATTTTEIR